MIDHVWSVLCSAVVTDKDTNNVSLFNVVEQVRVPNLDDREGRVILQLTFVTLWARSDFITPVEGEARLWLVHPDGESEKLGEYQLNLQDYERLRGIRRLPPLPLQESGRYHFRLELRTADGEDRWVQVAQVPLKVIVQDAEELSAQTME